MKQSDIFNTEQELMHKQFLQREYSVSHLSFENEFAFYNAVKEGNIKTLDKIMLSLKNEKLGHLSDDNIRNLKYHLIITIAMITRFCIEGGMQPEAAYTLSDIYIQKLDTCTLEDEINSLHKNAVYDFARKMKQIHSGALLSKPVLKTMDYIYDHLHEKITLDAISEYVSLNKTYLCKLFKSETNMTIGSYITKKKIEAAKNMLLYSSYTPTTISSYLSFSSYSHFIEVFKKESGYTPKEYIHSHYRTEL